MIRRWIQRACLLAVFCCLLTPRAYADFVGATFADIDGSAGTTVDVTRSVTAGNYLLVIGAATSASDFALTFTTQTGTTSAWTELATANIYNDGDDYGQEAAWATATNTESITVRLTTGASTPDRFIALVEMSGVTAYDTAAYARDTASAWETAGLSNINGDATRVIIGAWWGGGVGAAQSPYTDGGAGWNFGGNFARVQYINESTVNSRTGAFAAGTGVSPAHVTQFIFTDTVSGGGSALPVIIQQQSNAANDDAFELVANSRP